MRKKKVIRPAFRSDGIIAIGPHVESDVDPMFMHINDSETTQYLAVNTPMSKMEEKKFFETVSARKPHEIIFAIFLVKTGEYLGNMGLHRIDFINGTASTGSFIGEKRHRGKGYGTRAKMLVLDYAFNTLNLRKIYSSVIAYNGRSKRCLEKCGYHEEGTRKLQLFRNGKYWDEILMAVFKEDFLKLNKKKK